MIEVGWEGRLKQVPERHVLLQSSRNIHPHGPTPGVFRGRSRESFSFVLAESDASALAGEIAAMSRDEAAHYDFLEPTLYLLSLVSEECERKVLEMFTAPGEDRDGFVERRTAFAEWIRNRSERAWGWTIEDVLFDRRTEQSG